jgi:hypothetical protein
MAGFDTKLNLSQGPANPHDTSEMFGKRKWELIVLGERRKIFLMVIEQHEDFAARVGMMTVYCRNFKLFREKVHM